MQGHIRAQGELVGYYKNECVRCLDPVTSPSVLDGLNRPGADRQVNLEEGPIAYRQQTVNVKKLLDRLEKLPPEQRNETVEISEASCQANKTRFMGLSGISLHPSQTVGTCLPFIC